MSPARCACSPKKVSLPACVRGGELLQHQAPEQLGEHQHRQEEVGPGGDPALAIRRETAAGHDHVHVRMMRHGRAPGVQHRGDGDPGAQMLRVGGDREHGLGRGLEQQVVDHRLVGVGDVADRRRQREDDVEVGHGQQLGLPLFHPRARRGALALRAVPVAAAVVGDDGMAAVLAARDVPAESRRAAALDGAHHLHLGEAHVAAVGLTPSGAVVAEDVRDLQSRPSHECWAMPAASPSVASAAASRSSGLVTARSTLVATCV